MEEETPKEVLPPQEVFPPKEEATKPLSEEQENRGSSSELGKRKLEHEENTNAEEEKESESDEEGWYCL